MYRKSFRGVWVQVFEMQNSCDDTSRSLDEDDDDDDVDSKSGDTSVCMGKKGYQAGMMLYSKYDNIISRLFSSCLVRQKRLRLLRM